MKWPPCRIPAQSQDFKLTERFNLEFRAESQNFTNTPAWNNPDSDASAVQYNADGSIANLNNFMTSTGVHSDSPRQVRFGLKLTF
ncbi:MAG: hypothetical protein ACM336_05755 [Acidobacteriota bacterium]